MTMPSRWLTLSALVALVLLGCGEPLPPVVCATDEDCPERMCVDGVCTPAACGADTERSIGDACIAGDQACGRVGRFACSSGQMTCESALPAPRLDECAYHRRGVVTAGDRHTCALVDGGAVKCWGANDEGQLGIESRVDHAVPTAAVALGGKAIAVAAGYAHTCALLEDGQVKCWGLNTSGELGLGHRFSRGDLPAEADTVLSAVPLGAIAVEIAVGDRHTCALVEGGLVKCWGRGEFGQLGQGSATNIGDRGGQLAALEAVSLGRPATSIAAGGAFSCALLTGGDVKCWGANLDGQLGVGDPDHRGDQPGEMGDALPTVRLAGEVLTLAAGEKHVCAVLQGGDLKCWGRNHAGQLGKGDLDSYGLRPEHVLEAPGRLPFDQPALAVSAGSAHSCALFADGAVKCWGSNQAGQLGQGDTLGRGDDPDEVEALAAVGLDRRSVSVVTGRAHTCAVQASGDLRCWGWGESGQLGYGHNANLGDEPGEVGARLAPVNLGAGLYLPMIP